MDHPSSSHSCQNPPSPSNQPQNPPSPPLNEPQNPPPDVPEQARLRASIFENLISIEGRVTDILGHREIPPHISQFASLMQTVVTTVRSIDQTIGDFNDHREQRRRFYNDGLSQAEIDLNYHITKATLGEWFKNPTTGDPMPPNKKRISIFWCTHPEMSRHFWDRWWMVFDHPPHSGGSDVPLYFIKFLWVEFVLGQKPNYFDIRPFHGVGGGSSQQRLGARLRPNRPVRAAPLVTPLQSSVPVRVLQTAVLSSLGSLSQLTQNLTDQAANVASQFSEIGDDHGGHSGAGGSGAASTLHRCSSCGAICFGSCSPSTHSGSFLHMLHGDHDEHLTTGGPHDRDTHDTCSQLFQDFNVDDTFNPDELHPPVVHQPIQQHVMAFDVGNVAREELQAPMVQQDDMPFVVGNVARGELQATSVEQGFEQNPMHETLPPELSRGKKRRIDDTIASPTQDT